VWENPSVNQYIEPHGFQHPRLYRIAWNYETKLYFAAGVAEAYGAVNVKMSRLYQVWKLVEAWNVGASKDSDLCNGHRHSRHNGLSMARAVHNN